MRTQAKGANHFWSPSWRPEKIFTPATGEVPAICQNRAEPKNRLFSLDSVDQMPLKYADLLKQRPDQPCPCAKEFVPRVRTAFRLMRNPPTNDKDFAPPPMMLGGNLGPRDPCDRLALSFFDTPHAAQRLFNTMHKRLNENAVKRYGDHIGEIDLVVTDGIMSEPDQKGHINLHQETNAEFAHRVKNLQKVSIPATCGGSSAA